MVDGLFVRVLKQATTATRRTFFAVATAAAAAVAAAAVAAASVVAEADDPAAASYNADPMHAPIVSTTEGGRRRHLPRGRCEPSHAPGLPQTAPASGERAAALLQPRAPTRI